MNVKDVVNQERSHARRKLWKSRGTVHGTRHTRLGLPAKGQVARYIFTSAQNNTHLHELTWESLRALAQHYHADLRVGTFSYDTGAYGRKAVKRGTYGQRSEKEPLWFDAKLEGQNPSGTPYISDERLELAPGLVWCGEMNILPTQMNPLVSLETYSARKSAIFPHAKLAMRSVAAFQGEPAKLNYTTGAVTKRNYIQKRFGLIAEFHHVYGGLLVEVNHEGHWWVRQLNADKQGVIQDLDVVADGEKVTTGHKIESVTWGDLHGTMADPEVVKASLDLLDTLRPSSQVLHDVLEGTSINRHMLKVGPKNAPHEAFYRWTRGLHRVDEELRRTAELLRTYLRPWCKAVAPDANHDAWWLHSWLNRFDYRVDPANSELFLELQRHMYAQVRAGKMPRDVNMMQKAFELFGLTEVRFLLDDESFRICNGSIECGMHGHLGINGRRGTPENLAKMGRKANTAHIHSAGIYDGLYVAGTSSRLKWTYNYGPSSWTHSHVLTYPNGKRTIVTIYAGRWRA